MRRGVLGHIIHRMCAYVRFGGELPISVCILTKPIQFLLLNIRKPVVGRSFFIPLMAVDTKTEIFTSFI